MHLRILFLALFFPLAALAQYRPYFEPTQFGYTFVFGGSNIVIKTGVLLTNAMLTNPGINGNVLTWPLANAAGNLQNDGVGGLSWTPSSGGRLDQIAANAAATSSQLSNPVNTTNRWGWTNNTATASAFMLNFGLGHATAIGLNVREYASAESTGGSGSQHLANFETLSGSTASSIRVASQGTEIMRGSHNSAQMFFRDGTVSVPGISFPGDPNTGLVRWGTDNLGFTMGGVRWSSTDNNANLGVFYGANAGNLNNSAGRNTALGQESGTALQFGGFNTAVGGYAMRLGVANGTRNTALGHNSLSSASYDGGYSTAVGSGALSASTAGAGVTTANTSVGADSGTAITTGAYNTILGYAAGGTGTTASITNSTLLGHQAQATASSVMVLGGTGAYVVNVGIDTAAPTTRFSIAEKFQVDSSGNLAKINNITAIWPAANAAGLVKNNGSGTFSFATLVTADVADDQITFAKFQNITDNRLLGRSSGADGDMQVISVGSGLSLSGGTLSATGGGVTFDAITAAAANSSRNNSTFTNEFRWNGVSDPGRSSFTLKFESLDDTAIGLDVREPDGLPGTAGGRVMKVGTYDATSSVTPFEVLRRGTAVFRVDGATGTILMADGGSSAPTLSFSSDSTEGLYRDSSYVYLQNSSSGSIALGTADHVITANSVVLSTMGTTSGVSFSNGTGGSSGRKFNTGDSSSTGIAYMNRVTSSSSGTVSLAAGVDNGGTYSGSVRNSTGAVTYNLPAATSIGTFYTYTVNTTSGVTIDPPGTDVIRFPTTVTSAGGTISSTTQGATITLVNVSSGVWFATSVDGTWSVTGGTTYAPFSGALSAITANTVSQTIHNGSTTNFWSWGIPPGGNASSSMTFAGTNALHAAVVTVSGQKTDSGAPNSLFTVTETTASTGGGTTNGQQLVEIYQISGSTANLFRTRGRATYAGQNLNQFMEIAASTGGSGSQSLVHIGTLAGSTANPLTVTSRGTEVFRVRYDEAQILAGAGSFSRPTYGFAADTDGGVGIDSLTFFLAGADGYNADSIRIAQSQIDFYYGSANVMQINTAGVNIQEVDGSPTVLNTGISGDGGIAYLHRVAAKSSTPNTLSASVTGGTLQPSMVFNDNGASAATVIEFDLPAATTIGNSYTFQVIDADGGGIKVDLPAGSDLIRAGASVTTAGGDITSTVIGSSITIVCSISGVWIATSSTGTWTYN